MGSRWSSLSAHTKTQQMTKERINIKFVPWKVSDKVWLKGKSLRLHYLARKLALKREGLFKISQVISPITYHLWLPPTWKILNVFHASLLSTYRETAKHGPNFVNPPLEEIDGEEEYEVTKILSHWGSPSHCSYLVSWKGYSSAENTWEPEGNLQHTQTIITSCKQWNNL